MLKEHEPSARLTPAQQGMVRENLGLVGDYLRKNTSIPARPMTRCEYDDLFQEGTIGLMRASVRFEPGRDQTFVAFALRHIHGAVSRALAERFATVRVPVKRVKEAGRRRREAATELAKGNVRDSRSTASHACAITSNLGEEDVHLRDRRITRNPDAHLLGDLLRERYEQSVRAAADRVRQRGRGRADRTRLIDLIIADRLLIPEESERTSLRQIARELKCTAGRALTCERQIATLAAGLLSRDPVFARIRELAASEPDSLRTEVDSGIIADLAARENRHFREQMLRLNGDQQQALILRLVSEACGSRRHLASLLFQSLGREPRTRILMEYANAADPSAAA